MHNSSQSFSRPRSTTRRAASAMLVASSAAGLGAGRVAVARITPRAAAAAAASFNVPRRTPLPRRAAPAIASTTFCPGGAPTGPSHEPTGARGGGGAAMMKAGQGDRRWGGCGGQNRGISCNSTLMDGLDGCSQKEPAVVASSGHQVGSVEVILGPMFSGKSTRLLERVAEEEAGGRICLVVKPTLDDRYGNDSVVTHNGVERRCQTVPTLSSLLGSAELAGADVVAVDESQFFGDLLEFVREASERQGKMVVVAGLDGDFRRRTFGQTLELVPLADRAEKLLAECGVCKGPAAFSLRKVADDRTTLVGGADVYMPVCRAHYLEGSD